MSEKLVTRALSTNAYTLQNGTGASYINPILWVKEIGKFKQAALVVTPLAKVYNDLLGQAGTTLNVQFNAELTAAALTETTAITPNSFGYTQVQFSPSEVGLAVALTRKERIRSINDIMSEKSADMGYALAKYQDADAISTCIAGASTAVVANEVAVSAIASSDTMTTDSIADAITALRKNNHNAKYMVIHPNQENSLIKLAQFIDASVYGGREAVMNGEIGKYLGVRILVTTQIPVNATTSTAYDALVLDDNAFGLANKMNVRFDADYKNLEREFVLAAVEEYDFEVLRGKGIATVTSYGG